MGKIAIGIASFFVGAVAAAFLVKGPIAVAARDAGFIDGVVEGRSRMFPVSIISSPGMQFLKKDFYAAYPLSDSNDVVYEGPALLIGVDQNKRFIAYEGDPASYISDGVTGAHHPPISYTLFSRELVAEKLGVSPIELLAHSSMMDLNKEDAANKDSLRAAIDRYHSHVHN